MKDVIALVALALLAAFVGPALLAKQQWLQQSPRLGIMLWLATLWSSVTALFLAFGLTALDSTSVRALAADLIHACVTTFHDHYGTHPAAASAALAALMLGALVLAMRGVWWWRRTRTLRRRHRQFLDLVARPHAEPGVWVVDYPVATAYCLPGRGGRVVLTSGALRRLRAEEVVAVVAHERAHLSGRHHFLMGGLQTAEKLFPFLPIAGRAPHAVGFLLERLADNRACRDSSPEVLTAALRAMSSLPAPATALGISSGSTAGRIAALGTSTGSTSRTRQLVASAMTAGLVALPFILAVGPALGVAFSDYCVLPPAGS